VVVADYVCCLTRPQTIYCLPTDLFDSLALFR